MYILMASPYRRGPRKPRHLVHSMDAAVSLFLRLAFQHAKDSYGRHYRGGRFTVEDLHLTDVKNNPDYACSACHHAPSRHTPAGRCLFGAGRLTLRARSYTVETPQLTAAHRAYHHAVDLNTNSPAAYAARLQVLNVIRTNPNWREVYMGTNTRLDALLHSAPFVPGDFSPLGKLSPAQLELILGAGMTRAEWIKAHAAYADHFRASNPPNNSGIWGDIREV